MAKQSIIVAYRVNRNISNMRDTTFREVRRRCRKPYASGSKISRALWLVLFNDKRLRGQVLDALCNFLKCYDMGE